MDKQRACQAHCSIGMFELEGTRYDSISALTKAHPVPIDRSVHDEISTSHVWNGGHILPQDAASKNWQDKSDYERVSKQLNNASFSKHLRLRDGKITWDGALALHVTRDIRSGEELLAPRGVEYWGKRHTK